VVEEAEFCELLEYLHRQSNGNLSIPSRKRVRTHILDLEQEMVDGFQAMFVGCVDFK